MNKKMSSDTKKRLEELQRLTGSPGPHNEGPHVVLIERNGDVFDVIEYNYSPRRKMRKQFTIDALEKYVQKGTGTVIIDDFDDEEETLP